MNNTTSKISFTDLTGVTITSYDGDATLSISGNDIVATGGAGTVWNLLLSDGTLLPLQQSYFDISGNDNHATLTDITWDVQDDYHYNIINGFDLYLDDATSTDYIYVPYVGGSPVVISITGYTKQSSHPAQYWLNDPETGFILGATTFDGTGWDISTVISGTDTNEHFWNSTTGYGVPIFYEDCLAVWNGDYAFMNVTEDRKYKDLIYYGDGNQPTFADSIKIYKFIGQEDNLVFDEDHEYVYTEEGYGIIAGG